MKKIITLTAIGFFENLDESKTYIIRKNQIMEVEFTEKPVYRVISSRLPVLEVISESIQYGLKPIDYEPHGSGKVSFAQFGKEDKAITEADFLLREMHRKPFPEIDGNE